MSLPNVRAFLIERRALQALLGALSLAVILVAVRPVRVLLIQPFMEDTYYALSVARNLASGQGLTIDGAQWTNGFQPLFTVVEALAFLANNDEILAIRLILLVQGLALLAAGMLLGIIVRDALGRETTGGRAAMVVTPLLFLGSLFTLNVALNGLETGPLMLGYAFAWWYYQRQGLSTQRQAIVFGLILGLLILTRIDAAIVVVVLGVVVWRGVGAKRAITAVLVAALTSAPWFMYNLVWFGSLMPTSGTAQTAVAMNAERATQILEALSVTLMPWLPLSSFDKMWSIALRLVAVGIIAIVLSSRGSFRDLSPSGVRSVQFGTGMLIGYLGLAAYYATTSFAIWFYGRYLAPLCLIGSACLSMLVCKSFNRWLALATGMVGLVGIAASIGLWTTNVYPGNPMFTDQLALVRSTVPESDVVAAKQTGTIGFFRERVVNLDGKVNPEALTFRNNLPELLGRDGINWICDYPGFISDVLGDTTKDWDFVSERGDFACARRATPIIR